MSVWISDGDDAPRVRRNPFQPAPLPFVIDDDDNDLEVEDENLEPDPFSGFGEPSASLSRPMGKLKTNRLRDRWPSRPFVHPEDVTRPLAPDRARPPRSASDPDGGPRRRRRRLRSRRIALWRTRVTPPSRHA